MNSRNKDFTTKDLVDTLKDLRASDTALIKDVMSAIQKLKDTEQKLDEARELYHKPISSFIKKAFIDHGKFSISAIIIGVIVIILIFFGGVNYLVQGRDVWFKTKDLDAGMKLNFENGKEK